MDVDIELKIWRDSDGWYWEISSDCQIIDSGYDSIEDTAKTACEEAVGCHIWS